MRQTLLSRWQGALLASSLEATLTFQEQASPLPWESNHQGGIQALANTATWKPNFPQETLSTTEKLLHCLPLSLFFFDEPEALKQQVLAILNPARESIVIPNQNHSINWSGSGSLPSSDQDGRTTEINEIAIIAYLTTLSWILREKRSQQTLFQDLLSMEQIGKSHEILQTLQTNLEQGETLRKTQSLVSDSCQEIWLALYCFASSPDDLGLTLRRAGTIVVKLPLVFPLVGALSGARNGISGIPIPWRYHLQEKRRQWEIELQKLFATWSGSYEFAKMNQPLQTSAIAPSGVIQPRWHHHHYPHLITY